MEIIIVSQFSDRNVRSLLVAAFVNISVAAPPRDNGDFTLLFSMLEL